MKICWFDRFRLGLVDGDVVRDVSAVLDRLPAPIYPAPNPSDALVSHLPRLRDAIEEIGRQAPAISLAQVQLRRSVAAPGKIIGVPVNYLKHVEEAERQREDFGNRYQGSIEEQGFFLKATGSLVGAGDGIAIAFPDRRNDHEIELGVVIGKPAYRVSEAEAMGYVAGYTIALDMVVRGPQDRSMRKSADTYSVLGPWLVTADEIPHPESLSFSLSIGGSIRQASNTRFMIMSLARQIAFASQFYTLWPGDVIMSGTCEGVGPVAPGDMLHCEMDSIGSMDVPVRG